MSRRHKRPQQNQQHNPGQIAGKRLSRRQFSLSVSGIILVGVAEDATRFSPFPRQADSTASHFMHPGTSARTMYQPHDTFAGTSGCTWSPDGRKLALFQERNITLYDSETGLKGLCYEQHTDEILTVKWSGDNRYLASSGFDPGVYVWEAATGNTITSYQGHSQIVREIAWSPRHPVLASAGYDRTVQVWEALTGKLLLTCIGHEAEIIALAWSPDSRHLVSTDLRNTTMLWCIN